ncbi:MAG: hypothetical protein H7177_16095 [Rhizobacter sp.]|nr:hypothetical protein [Bacteriovorax sp.]
MNKKVVILILGIFISKNSFSAVNTPSNDRGPTKEFNVRVFYKVNDSLTAISYLEVKDPSFDFQQRSAYFGARYSLSENIKFGAFAGYLQSQKHNDSWIKDGNDWKWDNNASNEMVYYPEVSYRNLIGDFVYEVKVKYVFSSIFNEKDFFTKFNLIYDFSPRIILIGSDEIKFSFANKEKTLSENWIYLSPFYKINPHFFIGPTIGYFKRFWTTSEVHKTLRTNSYQSNDSSVSLGLNLNIYLN